MLFKRKRKQVKFLVGFVLITVSCHGQTKTQAAKDPAKPVERTKMIVLPEGVSQETMFRCSFKDNAGNLWFGTTGAGVYKYDGKVFSRYAENEGLSTPLVYSITQDVKGTVWVGTENGVFSYKDDRFVRLEIPSFNSPNGRQQVYCVLGDQKGNLWFGTENQGLWRYSESGFTNFSYMDSTWNEVPKGSSKYEQNGFVQSLAEDKKGNIWISMIAGGLNYYDGKSFHRVTGDHSKAHVFQMIADKSGNIWMATRIDGVCRYDGKVIESFTQKQGVLDNNASSLAEAADGTIWIGSLGKAGSGGQGTGGLSHFDGKTVTSVPSAGMRSNIVWTVVEDNSGGIWVGTKKFGLYRYDGKSFTEFTTFYAPY